MTKCRSVIITRTFIALLSLCGQKMLGCGQGASTSTISPLPTLGGSVLQVNALNNNGQMTGFSYTRGDLAAHAFFYSAGSLTDLGTLGGDMSQSFALNSLGQVVGDADTAGNASTHAFLYSAGRLQDLGALGGSFSSASAINDAGQVAGTSLTANWAAKAFLYSGGVLHDLGDLGGGSSDAVAINQHGSIAGDSSTVDWEDHAFLYTNGVMHDLGTLGGDYSSAYALNNADAVVGESSTPNWQTHAFLYSGGVMSDLGTLGGTYSSASAVNDLGQVIGIANTANDRETHGFVFTGGVMTDLGTLGGTYTTPLAINSTGQIVGYSGTATGTSHAFLWQNGAIVDLNTLLPTNSGWQLLSAQLINDPGQVVGFGLLNGIFRWFVMSLSTASANLPPVAVAGPEQTIDCSTQAILDGSQSSDPDHDPLTFEWSNSGTVLGTSATLSVSLPQGTNVVTLKVTDSCGESAQASVTIKVIDTTPPTIVSAPTLASVSADDNGVAPVPDVLTQIVVSDNCTPANLILFTQTPAAGTQVSEGPHPIVVTLTDASGNSSSSTFSFTVVDTTPPKVSGLSNVTIPANVNCLGAVPNVLPKVVTTDNCTPANLLLVGQAPAAGTMLPAGTYLLTVTATDAAGNQSSQGVMVTVADTTPPMITSLSVNPSTLTSPNKEFVPVTVSVSASDNCDGAPVSKIVAITCNEAMSAGDFQITGNLTASLAAIRNPAGNGRIYTITVATTDLSGNSSQNNVTVTVPKGNGNGNGNGSGKHP